MATNCFGNRRGRKQLLVPLSLSKHKTGRILQNLTIFGWQAGFARRLAHSVLELERKKAGCSIARSYGYLVSVSRVSPSVGAALYVTR
jgi:hypothetical protein